MDNKQIIELDNLIKAGRLQKVQTELEALVLPQVPRNLYAKIANIAWRSGLATIGLKLLNSIIREEQSTHPASEQERVEYAQCLRQIGCSTEALTLLNKYSSHSPWVEQAKAFALISDWNYPAAAAILKNILSQEYKDYPAYQKEVIRINYLACLIFLEDWPQAHEQIELCLQSKEMSPRLLTNLAELQLQCSLGEKNYETAKDNLAVLMERTGEGIEGLYLKKWQAVYKSQFDKKAGKSALFEVRHEALKLKRWETVRDCDLHIALIHKNETFLKRLLFATPFESYRTKILRHLPSHIEIPSSFEFRMLPDEIKIDGSGARNKNVELTIDLAKGKLGNKKLKVGLLHHRLLSLLCKDLYRPHSVGSLFYGLFPEEYFNPNSSPNRIYQAVKGLREYFIEEELCLDIDEENGQYRLITKNLIALILKKDFEVGNRQESQLEMLRGKLAEPFTTKEVATYLNCSLKTAQRLLSNALSSGICIKLGQGSKTSFSWKK